MSRLTILRRLLSFLRPFAGEVALSIGLGLATVAAGVGLIATSAYLISAAALHPSVADLEVAIVGVRALGLSRAVFRYLERLISHSVNFRLLAALRVWFYEQIEPLAPARLQDFRAGDLLARAISDIETLEAFYVRAVAPPAVALLGILAAWVFIGAYSLRLAFTLAGSLVFVAALLPVLAHFLSRGPSRQLVQARAEMNAALVDGVQGIADLLAFGGEDTYQECLHALNARCQAAQRQLSGISAMNAALSTVAVHLGGWAVLLLAIPLVQSGQIQDVFLAMLYLGAIASFEAVLPVPTAAQQLETSLESASRLFTLGNANFSLPLTPNTSPRIDKTGSNPDGQLSIHGLRFRYAPDLPYALDGLDLDLSAGQRIALVGPSGAGKSTLFNLLLRFWDYQEGSILWKGVDLHQIPEDDFRRQLGIVQPAPYLFNTSLLDNLRLGCPEASMDQVIAATQAARLHDWITSLPQGYQTMAGERGLRLSGGERQRLAIARALLKDPALLLLDEPTAALDGLTAQSILDLLLDVTMRKSLLLITHRLAGLERMDKIIVLSQGRVIERGRHAELVAAQGLYYKMLAIQENAIKE